MHGARKAATIAASPVLVWVKGKNVSFEKGTETTAYVSGDARLDESQPRTSPTLAPDSAADRGAASEAGLTNADIDQMQKARLSEETILSKIASSATNYDIGPRDLIQLKDAGVKTNIINAVWQKSGRR